MPKFWAFFSLVLATKFLLKGSVVSPLLSVVARLEFAAGEPSQRPYNNILRSCKAETLKIV